MSRTTLQEKFVAALKARGHTEVKRLSGCLVMTRGDDKSANGPSFYYVGSGGSLRVGRTRNNGIPVKQSFKDTLLKEYDALPRS